MATNTKTKTNKKTKTKTKTKKEMTLVAAAKPQLKSKSKRDWSKTKAERFLSVLGETCNVSEACRRSRVPMTVAYRQRKLDAGFRAGWVETLAGAYRRLELMLLERALNGTEKIVRATDGNDRTMREYSDRLALALLKYHRDTASDAEAEMPADQVDEIRARVLRKLQRLKKRNDEKQLRESSAGDGASGGSEPGAAGETDPQHDPGRAGEV